MFKSNYAWKCDACFTKNKDPNAAKCVACGAPNPSAPKEVVLSGGKKSGFAKAPAGGGNFSLGGGASAGAGASNPFAAAFGAASAQATAASP